MEHQLSLKVSEEPAGSAEDNWEQFNSTFLQVLYIWYAIFKI